MIIVIIVVIYIFTKHVPKENIIKKCNKCVENPYECDVNEQAIPNYAGCPPKDKPKLKYCCVSEEAPLGSSKSKKTTP